MRLGLIPRPPRLLRRVPEFFDVTWLARSSRSPNGVDEPFTIESRAYIQANSMNLSEHEDETAAAPYRRRATQGGPRYGAMHDAAAPATSPMYPPTRNFASRE